MVSGGVEGQKKCSEKASFGTKTAAYKPIKSNYTVIKIERYFILIVLSLLTIAAKGQIRGTVIDAETGDGRLSSTVP